MVAFSILDLSPVRQGSDASDALRNTLDLAQHAERWGYHRFWLAEHHNMTGVASAATSVVLAHVAAGTRTIRLGAGGVMLPNHAPLVIAEQFGTLAALHPGRIDLGLGRAPGSDPLTARALRRDLGGSVDRFPSDVLELRAYFRASEPGQAVQAVPGAGLEVPIWILGSSLYGAQLAAALGLPFAFASHFAPEHLTEALALYRNRFRPGELLEPHAMVAASVIVAPTDAEARRLQTSQLQQFLQLRRGTPGKLPPPVDTMDGLWSTAEKAMVDRALACAVAGSPETVERGVRALLERTRADEFIATAQIFDHPARLRSFELLADLMPRFAPLRETA